MRIPTFKLAVLATAAFASNVVSGAPVIYFGENQTPNRIVQGDPLTARNSFASQLSGVGTETFESQVGGATSPLAISFPGLTSSLIGATITGTGSVTNVGAGGSSAGRFNTTGATAAPVGGKYWTVSGRFVIDLSTPISAFGFYGTDIGDFNGQTTVALLDTNNQTTSFTVPNTIDAAGGSLLFWGFIDNTNSYSRITFGNTAAGVDTFGLDDMIVGDRQQIVSVPVPGTIALLSLGLLMAGTGIARRR